MKNALETFAKNKEEGRRKPAVHWIGRKHTEETKQKMRKARREGIINHNLGKRSAVIYNGTKTKRVSLDQLDQYLAEGWSRGF